MAIVTISHEMGSGGSVIGARLAERLELRYVDQDLIARAAERYGCVVDALTHLDEVSPGLLERFDAETRRHLIVLQSAVLDVAEEDNSVIMGRGGQVLLGGIAHVLRVFVRAPLAVRVRRVTAKMAGEMGETVDARTVAEMVRRSDQQKLGRMRHLFDVDWRDPALYDLVIDTGRLGFEEWGEMLISLVSRLKLVATEASRQAVRDRALASRVRCSLAARSETRRQRITVEAESGVVRLEGAVDLEPAVDVTRAVPGVAGVRTQLVEVPPIPPFLV